MSNQIMDSISFSNDPEQLEAIGAFAFNKATSLKILQRLNDIISDKKHDPGYSYWYRGRIDPKVEFQLEDSYAFFRDLFNSEERIDSVNRVSSRDWSTNGNFRNWIENVIYFTIGNGTLVQLDFNTKDKYCFILYYSSNQDIILRNSEDNKRIEFMGHDTQSMCCIRSISGTLSQKDNNKSLYDILMPVSVDELLTRVQNLQYTPPAKHK